MTDPIDPVNCRSCAANRALIQKLDERLTALEIEVYGAPIDVQLAELENPPKGARWAALDEYHRLQREEFLRKLPDLKKAADERRAAYEQFMRARGFEP